MTFLFWWYSVAFSYKEQFELVYNFSAFCSTITESLKASNVLNSQVLSTKKQNKPPIPYSDKSLFGGANWRGFVGMVIDCSAIINRVYAQGEFF